MQIFFFPFQTGQDRSSRTKRQQAYAGFTIKENAEGKMVKTQEKERGGQSDPLEEKISNPGEHENWCKLKGPRSVEKGGGKRQKDDSRSFVPSHYLCSPYFPGRRKSST
jgi:hypothetical protein